jgi:Mg-chelatase subunit ChlD
LESQRDHPGVRAVLFDKARHIATRSSNTVDLQVLEEWQRTGTKPTDEMIMAIKKAERKAGVYSICHHSHANHIVYLIDCSQTMAPHLARIKKQVARSINRLRGNHRFCVIALHDGKATVVSGPRLVVPVKANRASVLKALNGVKAKGRSDFRAGLEQAWHMFRPTRRGYRLVYLLSNGKSLDANSAIKGLPSGSLTKTAGEKHGMCINTFQYGSPTPDSQKNMERLADKSSGRYRAIGPPRQPASADSKKK